MPEQEKSNIDHLIHHTEEYLKTRQELSKLAVAEKTSIVASTFFSSIVIFGLFFFTVVFASIALAFALARIFGDTMYGFLAVTGFYFLAGILLLANRKKWMEVPIMNMIIKNILKEEDHDQS